MVNIDTPSSSESGLLVSSASNILGKGGAVIFTLLQQVCCRFAACDVSQDLVNRRDCPIYGRFFKDTGETKGFVWMNLFWKLTVCLPLSLVSSFFRKHGEESHVDFCGGWIPNGELRRILPTPWLKRKHHRWWWRFAWSRAAVFSYIPFGWGISGLFEKFSHTTLIL